MKNDAANPANAAPGGSLEAGWLSCYFPVLHFFFYVFYFFFPNVHPPVSPFRADGGNFAHSAGKRRDIPVKMDDFFCETGAVSLVIGKAGRFEETCLIFNDNNKRNVLFSS
ncbi:MAG: hypothetical protein LBS30_06675 [Planctomycetota bacterium]|nr:hypothetical protein [Planctomycetota bacterium]